MWSLKTLTFPPAWLDISFNAQFKTALDAVVMPTNKATANASASAAGTDAGRRSTLDAFKNPLESIAITPWRHGEFNGNKNSMGFVLSPLNAQKELAKQISLVSWESALVFIVYEDNPARLIQSINELLAIFPDRHIEAALRRATHLDQHEHEKLFIKVDAAHDKKTTTMQKLGAFKPLLPTVNNVAISEATASDDDPIILLTDFKTKRVDRLAAIQSDILSITDQQGFIRYVLHLSGGKLSEKLDNILPPNQGAALCCMLAIGGSAIDMQPLEQVFNL